MSDHGSGAAHEEHGEIHLPDPSIWPFVAGFAALVLGAALIWWADNPDGNFTGPLLGVAIAVTLVAGGGWAYQDGVMKRKAEEGHVKSERDARYTQVVTFALAEGQYDAARDSGVLHAMDKADSSLRDLTGFQDLRIIAAPGGTEGPTQVLVETTWAAREGLATYEETRRTMLDIVNSFPDQAVPGSVQVFDMEVVRDTKDVAVRFSKGAATALLGGLIVGGFMVGAGLNLFEGEHVAAENGGGGGTPTVTDPGAITATDNKFDRTTLEAPPNVSVTFTMTNKGKVLHNLHFYDKPNGSTLAAGSGSNTAFVGGGEKQVLTFTTPGAGTYFFQCDLHPTEMKGDLVVKDGAPVPGAAAAAPAAASPAAR